MNVNSSMDLGYIYLVSSDYTNNTDKPDCIAVIRDTLHSYER